jgi:group I intron endonuclease
MKNNVMFNNNNIMKNNVMFNSNVVPVVSYANPETDKSAIYKENKGKCGVYRWNNKITGKSYVGSSISLRNRFCGYYSLNYLNRRVKKGSSAIYGALLKYGYSKFSLDILEYCKPDVLISREQYYIDLLKPKYNILETAGSRFGTKQSKKAKQLISKALKGRIFLEESKAKMQAAVKLRQGIETSFFGKTHTAKTIAKISATKSLPVKIINIKTGTEKIFLGNIQAAKYLKIGESTLRRYKKSGKLLGDKYLISNT